MLTRKRKRTLSSPAPEDDDDTPIDDDGNDSQHHSTAEQLKKEGEIWEAFKEEYHEAIEQLPLNIHRQYALLEELDRYVAGRENSLSSLLHDYMLRRQKMALHPLSLLAHSHPNGAYLVEDVHPEGEDATSITMTGLTLAAQQDTPPPRGSEPHQPPNDENATRHVLAHIGCQTEEIIRVSEEKVNVSRAVYDSVDRQVRMLDLAVRELESSIVKGAGAAYMPHSLPDLSALRSNRYSRPTLTAVGDEEMDAGGSQSVNGENETNGNVSVTEKLKRGPAKTRGKAGRSKQHTSSPGQETPFTITLPAQPAIADADEPTYCYCNQVSFGEMIACDSKKCEREWFHLKCAGLDLCPEDGAPWYCRDCRPVPRRKRR